MSGSIFADPSFGGLLGISGALAQAAMPSRMPVPTGAALGFGAAGAQQGAQAAQQFGLGQQQLQAAQLQNQYNSALMPAKLGMLSGVMGANGGSPLGMPAGQGGGGAAQTGGDPASSALMQLARLRDFALASGDGRSAAQFDARIQSAAQSGVVVGADGQAYPVPNAAAIAANFAGGKTSAEEAAKLPAYAAQQQIQTQQAGPRAEAVATAELGPSIQRWAQTDGQTPTTITVPDGKGGMVEQTMTKAQAAQFMAQNGGKPITDPVSAFASVPDQFKQPLQSALLKHSIPPAAWPAAVATIAQESSWNPGNNGGLGSVTAATAKAEGYDPSKLTDPTYGLDAAMNHFGVTLQQAGGDPLQAAIRYNGGGDPNYGASITARLLGANRGVGTSPAAPPGVPGKPVLTPQQQAQQVGAEAGSKAESERLVAIQQPIIDQARESSNALNKIDQAQTAMAAAAKAGLPSGYFPARLAEAAAAAKSAGVNLKNLGIDPSAIASQQAAHEALVQISGEILKRLFPQRITNMDVKLYGDALPNYGMDPAALDQILTQAKAAAQYDVNKSNSMLAYRQQHGNLAGWEESFLPNNYGPNFFDALKGTQSAGGASQPGQSAQQAPQPAPQAVQQPAPKFPRPPDAAVGHLKANPALAPYFDQKFGPGASRAVLGQ